MLYMATAGAVISDDGVYRYSLERTWEGTDFLFLFIMLNPSTADAQQSDPTLEKCIKYAKKEGASGVLIVNLFGYRTPSPSVLKAEFLNGTNVVGKENDFYVKSLLLRASRVVCAWGNLPHPRMQYREQEIINLITKSGISAFCLKKNLNGTPGHPLYLRGDLTFQSFLDNGK